MKLFTSSKAFGDINAWILIVVGCLLFALRTPFSSDGFINLPVLATLVQLAGGIFVICGFSIIASMIFWSNVQMGKLMDEVHVENKAAAMVIIGLMIFNGLMIIGFALWLGMTFNGVRG